MGKPPAKKKGSPAPGQTALLSAEQIRGAVGAEALAKLAADARKCSGCPLAKDRTTVVFGEGPAEAFYALVGEAPGGTEDMSGMPFVGRSGSLLNRLLAGAGISRADAWVTNAVACFPEEVKVLGWGIESLFRREYEGEFVTVETAVHELPGTPNHPLLTQRGWVPLGELTESDYLVSGPLREEVASAHPYMDYGPTPLGELFTTASAAWVRERVVGTHMDFHGDGMNTQIEVVGPHSQLRGGLNPTIQQPLLQKTLSSSPHSQRLLETPGSGLAVLENRVLGPVTPTGCGMCSFCQLATFHGGQTGEPHPQRRTTSAESPSMSHNRFTEAGLADVNFVRECLQRLSGQVTLHKIRKIRRGCRRGHVYNLRTLGGWYTANGVVVSNCRPPLNRTPTQTELDACAKFCQGQLRAVRPKAILCLGRTAAMALTGDRRPLNSQRGIWQSWEGIPLKVTYHPAFLLRPDGELAQGEAALDFLAFAAFLSEHGYVPSPQPAPEERIAQEDAAIRF